MPNWVVHLGVASVAGPLIASRRRVLTLFLLGSILPDIAIIGNVLWLDMARLPFLPWDFAAWYFQPFHSPFCAVFYGLAVALLFSGDWRINFTNIYSATLLHFGLDQFQKHTGFHDVFLFPFSLKPLFPGIWTPDSAVFFVATVAATVVLVFLVVFRRNVLIGPGLKLTGRRAGWSVLILVALMAVPFASREMFFNQNFHWLRFFNGENFEGRAIEIGNSRVVSLEPVRTAELNKILELRFPDGGRPEGLKLGDWASYKGVLRNGRIEVSYFHVNRRYWGKIFVSLGGGVFIIWILIINLRGGPNHGVRQPREEQA